ncbi:MAG: branched-chain amino acid transport system substrate-binding protein [Thermoleophilaceae bacterium]|jgi:ABC-type branched-subunit amino acid transport system substrate-binding protein|nr:branched-chain amino acid transport system substrate-binding protein [Thermoleophilaceae bacterium]MEA2400698.1 branched-chain amino acid transport system substrate-binding protein [Thermoleophilaceae bacterium]
MSGRNSNRRFGRIAAFLLASVVVLAGCGGGSDDEPDQAAADTAGGTIKVGLNLEQSGPGSLYGKSRIFGATAAVKKINADGGVKVGDKSYELELVICDNRTEVTYGVQCAQEGVEEGILWTTTPDIGFEGAYEIYRQAGILSLGNGGVAGAMLTEDAEAHPLLAFEFLTYQQLVESYLVRMKSYFPEAKTIAGLVPDDANGRTFGDSFKEYGPKYGLEYVAQQVHPPDATGDFSSYLTSLKAAKPDIVWLGYYPQVVQSASEQAAELDVAPIISAADIMPSDLEGVDHSGYPVISTHTALGWGEGWMPTDEDTLAAIEAIEAEAKGETYIQSIATLGYVGEIMVVAAAVEEAQSLEPEAIAAALKDAQYDGPLGPGKGYENHSIDLAQSTLLFDKGGETMEASVFESGFSEEPTETYGPIDVGK